MRAASALAHLHKHQRAIGRAHNQVNLTPSAPWGSIIAAHQLQAVGLQVLGLKRVRIGRVMLGDLPPGQWRYLRADEGFA